MDACAGNLTAAALERVVRDSARVARVRATALLDTPPEADFDRLTRLASRILGVPMALVTLVDGDRDFWKSCLGLPEPFASARETRIAPSFCQHAVVNGAPLVVRNAPAEPRFAALPAVTELGIRSYLGVPLVTGDGVPIGSFCVLDYVPREWRPEDVEMMIDLAAAVMTEVDLRSANREQAAAGMEAATARTRLEGILEGMSDGYIAMDSEWRVTALNPSALRIDGRTRGDLLGKSHWELWPNTIGTRVEEEYRRVMASGEVAHFEHHYDHPAPDLWHEIDVYRTVDGIACFYRDITTRRTLLESARQAQRAAENANRAKSEFVAQMSHELRTPLNAIMGYAQLMQVGVHGPVSEGQTQDLTRIQRAARSLTMIISDILNFAKIEAGHLALDIQTVDLVDVVANAGTLVEPQATSRGIVFNLVPSDLPIMVRADRERLQQIILNLLTNALRYNRPGGSITITCETSNETSNETLSEMRSESVGEPHGSMAVVCIADTGAGIAADKMEAIFDPFVQLGRGTSSPVDGVGLGLAIGRTLARAMGGDITVASTVGSGSTFMITVPLAPGGITAISGVS